MIPPDDEGPIPREIRALRARVAELEAELVAQWKWDDGSILRKRRIEKLIPAETLNA